MSGRRKKGGKAIQKSQELSQNYAKLILERTKWAGILSRNSRPKNTQATTEQAGKTPFIVTWIHASTIQVEVTVGKGEAPQFSGTGEEGGFPK